MPAEYYTSDSERTGLPVLNDKRRDEIHTCFTDDLQTHLRDRLERMANAHHGTGQPGPEGLCLRVLPASETAQANEVRGWFQWYGIVTDFSMPTNPDVGKAAGYAYVTFSDPEDAKEAFDEFRAPENADKIRRIEYATTAGERPRLAVVYPAAGEFECPDPAVKAAVTLQEMQADDTYATVLVKTSWELRGEDKEKLEEDREYALGSVLSPHVSIAYDMF
ncbi:hypothetical protein PG996_011338 [Apiospora saccharicola]|uniref:RRM domain-containing protein n=1 Tax=Apiospora saccharicola TaxID=335842 RepID=A0ABR1UEU6_9PEZI